MSWRKLLSIVIILGVVVVPALWWAWQAYAQHQQIFQTSYTSTWPARPASLAPQLGPNLLPNPSFEQHTNDAPDQWTNSSWGDNQATFVYLIAGGHNAGHAIQTRVSQYRSGDAKWFADPQPIQPNASYIYTDWYQADVPTSVVAAFTITDGSTVYRTLGNADASHNWKQVSFPFATPVNATAATVYHLLGQAGMLTVDEVSLQAYSSAELPEGLVSLTFDDGPKSVITNALPVLNQYHFPTTQYVTSGPVTTQEDPGATMSTQDLLQLHTAGHEIAAHTVTHPHLPTLSLAQIDAELTNSRRSLQQLIGDQVLDFASPYGEYDGQVIADAQKHYQSHRSVDVGYNDPSTFDPYNIRVQNVGKDTPVETVAAWIDYARQHRVWLVLVFHQIADSPGAYSYTPEHFAQAMSVLHDSGTKVVTVSQGLAEMRQAIGRQ